MHARRCTLGLAALLLVAVGACRQSSPRSQLVLELGPAPDHSTSASTEELLRRALPAVRARVDAICFTEVKVTLRGEGIVVDVSRASADQLQQLARDLTRPTQLDFKLINPRAGEPERRAPLDPRRVSALTLVGLDEPAHARVKVRFSAAAKEQLAWVTATHLSHRLTLIIDGELAAAAQITAPLRAGAWSAHPATPKTVLSPGAKLPALSYRELLALKHRLRAALTVPLRLARLVHPQ